MVLVLFTVIIATACSAQYSTEQLDSFATCIAKTDTKVYGAFWCPNCARQKKLFKNGWNILVDKGVYVECDPRGENPQPDLCIEKKVEKYPAWEFGDEKDLIVQIFEINELAKLTGCTITQPILSNISNEAQ